MSNYIIPVIVCIWCWVIGYICGKYGFLKFPIGLKFAKRFKPVKLRRNSVPINDNIKPYNPFKTDTIATHYVLRDLNIETSKELEDFKPINLALSHKKFPKLFSSEIISVQNMQNNAVDLFKIRTSSENYKDFQKFENIENRDKHSKSGLITNSNGNNVPIEFEDLNIKLSLKDLNDRTLEPGKHSHCHCVVTEKLKSELLQQLETFKDSELWWWNNLGYLCGSAGFVILKDDVAVFTETIWRS